MRGIERIPWVYDALMALPDRAWLANWRRWVAGGARGRTLEVGCGTGRNLALYGSGMVVVGLDLCWDNLSRSRSRAPGIPLVQGSAEALPFKDGSFDTVVSSLVFCSVSNPMKGLHELKRVLALRGALRMLEHVRSTRRVGAWMQEVLQPAWTWLSGGCHPDRDTERNVKDAGFRIHEEGRSARGIMRRFEARPVEPTAGGLRAIESNGGER